MRHYLEIIICDHKIMTCYLIIKTLYVEAMNFYFKIIF